MGRAGARSGRHTAARRRDQIAQPVNYIRGVERALRADGPFRRAGTIGQNTIGAQDDESWREMERETGLEPATFCLGIRFGPSVDVRKRPSTDELASYSPSTRQTHSAQVAHSSSNAHFAQPRWRSLRVEDRGRLSIRVHPCLHLRRHNADTGECAPKRTNLPTHSIGDECPSGLCVRICTPLAAGIPATRGQCTPTSSRGST